MRKLKAFPATQMGEAECAPVWRDVLPKAAAAHLDLPLQVLSVRQQCLDPEKLASSVGPYDLALALKCTGGGAGLARIDPMVLAAIIEILTLGEVGRGDVPDRVPTPTDAGLVGEALENWLVAVTETGADGVSNLQSVSAGAHLPNARAARLALADVPLEVTELKLDLGGGARVGEVLLAVPYGAEAKGAGSRRQQNPAVLQAGVLLTSELARVDLPYAKMRDLREGEMIEIPSEAIGSVRLRDLGGVVAAVGRLGQSGGFRAVRLQKGEVSPPPSAPNLIEATSREAPEAPEHVQTSPAVSPPAELEELIDANGAIGSEDLSGG